MSRIHRIIALLLLLAYASTGTAAFPACILALAEMDGSHEVQVRESEQGTQVLLHHAGHDYTPEVADHGSALARTLVRMCRPASEGDHSLSLRRMTASAANASDEAKHSLKDPLPLNILATMRFFQAQPEPGSLRLRRPPWEAGGRTCSQQSHRLVATVHLLI